MPAQPPVPLGGDLWGRFTLDPRLPAHAGLRASDADRDLIHQALATAYAEGRIDRSELDERTDGVAHAKTLGELPTFVVDLLPVTAGPLVVAGPDLVAQAEAKFRRDRNEALWGLLSSSAVVWVIWAVVMFGAFPWPIFVTVAAGMNYLRVVTNHRDIVADEVRRLEKKQRRQLPPGGSA
ncbi:MAG: DUF1707 domain-containing protein [Nocardioidaceae bacterium]